MLCTSKRVSSQFVVSFKAVIIKTENVIIIRKARSTVNPNSKLNAKPYHACVGKPTILIRCGKPIFSGEKNGDWYTYIILPITLIARKL